MNESPAGEIRALLTDLTVSDGTLQWVDTASRPAAMNDLGRSLAALVEAYGPHAVACWSAEDEAVLAHTVAAALDVPVSRADENLGLLTLDPEPPAGVERVLVVATRWTMEFPVGPLVSLLANRGKTVVGAVSLLPGDAKPETFPDIPYLVIASS